MSIIKHALSLHTWRAQAVSNLLFLLFAITADGTCAVILLSSAYLTILGIIAITFTDCIMTSMISHHWLISTDTTKSSQLSLIKVTTIILLIGLIILFLTEWAILNGLP